MKKTAVLGAVMGDEGKGHFVHHLSPQYNWVVRFAGGANAGHTIYRDGKKYVHNLLPSVDFRAKNTKAFLGSGMVLDLEQLRNEVRNAAVDFPEVGRRIYVDPDAFLVLPEHKSEDKLRNKHIGSTNRGIGPAYVSKMERSGKRVRDLFGKQDDADMIGQLLELGVQFSSALDLRDEFERTSVLYEGAQGVLLDLNHGTYPYVSCGDCTVAGIYQSGFGFAPPTEVYGVAKVYNTRVGEGPFPSEYFDEEAEALRKMGNEYGATTGRPRRVGAIDLPALKYAVVKGGITSLVLTKFDILNGQNRVKVCDSYRIGSTVRDPVCGADFFNAKPQYTTLSGWQDAQESEEVSDFVRFVEREVGVPVKYISCGTRPEDILSFT